MVVQFQELMEGLHLLLHSYFRLFTHSHTYIHNHKNIFKFTVKNTYFTKWSFQGPVTMMCFRLNGHRPPLDLHDVSLNILLCCWNQETIWLSSLRDHRELWSVEMAGACLQNYERTQNKCQFKSEHTSQTKLKLNWFGQTGFAQNAWKFFVVFFKAFVTIWEHQTVVHWLQS